MGCKLSKAPKVGDDSTGQTSLPNSAFVFIKPHAVAEATKALVKATLEANGVKIIKEGDIKSEVRRTSRRAGGARRRRRSERRASNAQDDTRQIRDAALPRVRRFDRVAASAARVTQSSTARHPLSTDHSRRI
jgi:hypothetical protein